MSPESTLSPFLCLPESHDDLVTYSWISGLGLLTFNQNFRRLLEVNVRIKGKKGGRSCVIIDRPAEKLSAPWLEF